MYDKWNKTVKKANHAEYHQSAWSLVSINEVVSVKDPEGRADEKA